MENGKLKYGIATDPYKVKLFKKELKKAGYDFELNPNPLPGGARLFTVMVEPEKMGDLTILVNAMNNKARKTKMH